MEVTERMRERFLLADSGPTQWDADELWQLLTDIAQPELAHYAYVQSWNALPDYDERLAANTADIGAAWAETFAKGKDSLWEGADPLEFVHQICSSEINQAARLIILADALETTQSLQHATNAVDDVLADRMLELKDVSS